MAQGGVIHLPSRVAHHLQAPAHLAPLREAGGAGGLGGLGMEMEAAARKKYKFKVLGIALLHQGFVTILIN